MALNMTESQLIGRRVVSQDGHVLGDLAGFVLDTGTWRVVQIAVKVRRQALESLQLKKRIFGTHTIRLPADAISGVSDAIVLKQRLDELSSAAISEVQSDEGVPIAEDAEIRPGRGVLRPRDNPPPPAGPGRQG